MTEGVAIRLTPGEQPMVQTHYVNSNEQPTKYGGKVGINFYRRPGTETPGEMGSLFATQQNIRVCASNPQVSFRGPASCPAR